MIGTIYLPDDYKDGEKRPGIIANSGWTGMNKVYPAMFARQMTKFGYVCMGFDYRGFKPSGGISGMDKYTTLEMEVDDVCNAITFFKHQPEVDPEHIALIGWGVGGAVCVTSAYRDKTVKAVATLNSFADGRRWMRMGMGNDKFYKMLRTLEEDKYKRVTTGDPVLRHPYEFYPNIDESGDFYTDHTLKELNGGVQDSIEGTMITSPSPLPCPLSLPSLSCASTFRTFSPSWLPTAPYSWATASTTSCMIPRRQSTPISGPTSLKRSTG